MTREPALFISHGSPLTVVTEDEYANALRTAGRHLVAVRKPTAVVVVSAHGLTPDGEVEVTADPKPRLIYDFGGFPDELYNISYPCPGKPDLAEEIAGRLGDAQLRATLLPRAGIDHGVWVPLVRLLPKADVPVVQVSMPFPSSPRTIFDMGRALAPLRDRGVLLIGSGGAVHNLRALNWHSRGKAADDWAVAFNTWLRDVVTRNAVEDLLDYEAKAPHASQAHPTPEHLYPVFFTAGCRFDSDRAETIVDEFQYECLSMYSFALTPTLTV
jgi:4,5-DOPA dioxygenase extradiol